MVLERDALAFRISSGCVSVLFFLSRSSCLVQTPGVLAISYETCLSRASWALHKDFPVSGSRICPGQKEILYRQILTERSRGTNTINAEFVYFSAVNVFSNLDTGPVREQRAIIEYRDSTVITTVSISLHLDGANESTNKEMETKTRRHGRNGVTSEALNYSYET